MFFSHGFVVFWWAGEGGVLGIWIDRGGGVGDGRGVLVGVEEGVEKSDNPDKSETGESTFSSTIPLSSESSWDCAALILFSDNNTTTT